MSGVATAIVGSAIISSNAASDAASTQANASSQASQASIAAQERMFEKQTALQEPFRQAGITSQNRLMELLGLTGGTNKTREQYRAELLPQYTTQAAQAAEPQTYTVPGGLIGHPIQTTGNGVSQGSTVDEAALNAEIDRRMAAAGTSADYGKYARDFNMSDFQADPGYAFRLSEGQKALDRSAAARGGLISGSALKAATRYGQDMGSQEYTNAFNRYQVNRTNQLAPLQSLMGAGQTSANTLTNAAGTLGANEANALSSGITGAANARASGYVGGANAINQGLSSYLSYNQGQNMINAMNQNNIMAGLQTPQGIANYFSSGK